MLADLLLVLILLPGLFLVLMMVFVFLLLAVMEVKDRIVSRYNDRHLLR